MGQSRIKPSFQGQRNEKSYEALVSKNQNVEEKPTSSLSPYLACCLWLLGGSSVA